MNRSYEDGLVGGAIALLLIGSAFPATSKFTLYVGGFLAFLVWVSAFQVGAAQRDFQLFIGGTA